MRRRAILERMLGKTNQSHHFLVNFFAELSIIGPNSDHKTGIPLHRVEKKPASAQKTLFIALLMIGPLAACQPAATEDPTPSPVQVESGCGDDGAFEAALFGSIETAVSWSGSDMKCENMQRPNGEGVRLRFSGLVAGERLAIIIAVPGLRRDASAAELPSNITASVEGSGRFFSTPNLDSCWTEVNSQTPVPGKPDTYLISGALFCVAALGEVNGDAAVSIPELSFSTLLEWQ
jgi:hypothetical protein